MTDQEVRVRCIEAAASVTGNPNTLQLAQEFYDFVQQDVKADEPAVEPEATPTTTKRAPRK